jgi:hypothetical protein
MNYKRAVIGSLLLIILIVSMLYSYQEYDKNDEHVKQFKEIFQHTENYTNTEVLFLAQVINVDSTNKTLSCKLQEKPYAYPRLTINLENISTSTIERGDLIDIKGTITGKNQVTATQLWINEPWKENLLYLRSLAGLPLVFYLFFTTWRLNMQTWRFERRKRHA